MGRSSKPEKPKLYGAAFSVYVQAVRLTLAAKSVAYDLQIENPFDPPSLSAEFYELQPFGKVPAFRHGSVRLYQADTIARYIDANFSGPPLLPSASIALATANQILGILNSYAYPNWVRRLYIQAVSVPAKGGTANSDIISKANPIAKLALSEIHRLGFPQNSRFLMGDTATLPDFFCAPMMACLMDTDGGRAMVKEIPKFMDWMLATAKLPYYTEIVT